MSEPTLAQMEAALSEKVPGLREPCNGTRGGRPWDLTVAPPEVCTEAKPDPNCVWCAGAGFVPVVTTDKLLEAAESFGYLVALYPPDTFPGSNGQRGAFLRRPHMSVLGARGEGPDPRAALVAALWQALCAEAR